MKSLVLSMISSAVAPTLSSSSSSCKGTLDWCRSDVRTRLNGFIDTKLEKDRVRQVIRGRAHGETLTAIGDQIGITRERVRQIEAKVIKTSHTIFQREQYIYKLFLDFGTPYITGASIAEYIGEYGPEAVSQCRLRRYVLSLAQDRQPEALRQLWQRLGDARVQRRMAV